MSLRLLRPATPNILHLRMESASFVRRGLADYGNQRGRGRGRGRSWSRGRGRGRGETANGSSAANNASPGSSIPIPSLASRTPKPKLTHFLALPLGHIPALRQIVSSFTDALLAASPAIPGLDQSVVIPPRRLHFTLGVMALDAGDSSSNEDAPVDPSTPAAVAAPKTLATAISLLSTIKPQIMEILGQNKLNVMLDNMDIMKPEQRDLTRAHIMWLGPSLDNGNAQRLKTLSEFVHEQFSQAGLVVDDGRPLKLHCTVVNTIYRKPRGRNRQPFSYASVLSSAALEAVSVNQQIERDSKTPESEAPAKGPVRVDFGEWNIDEIQICEMGSWGPEGEYVCVGRCTLE